MGGNVFAVDGLYTPRMPPEVYEKVLRQVIKQLKTVYQQVEAPLEAPGKLDHGDIDVLVVPFVERRPNPREIATLLGAVHFKGAANTTSHYALPWPDELHTRSGEHPDQISQDLESLKLSNQLQDSQKYVQVDINHNRTSEELTFTKFLHAHGDFWTIVGSMIRSFGLTCSDGGLYIRIEELEHWNKKRARVKIIDSPNEILNYLGIETKRFWKPFDSVESCMAFAATCRFYNPQQGQSWDKSRTQGEIKAEDKKHSQRSMFAYWLDDYLPSHRNVTAGRSASMTRNEVVEEAKTTFGEDFTERYESQKAQGLHELGESKMWAELRDGIPAEGSKLTYALKGLKAQVGATADRITDEDDSKLRAVRDEFRQGRFEIVKEWALAHWEAAALWQETWNREQSHRHLMQKLKREQVTTGESTGSPEIMSTEMSKGDARLKTDEISMTIALENRDATP